MDALTLALWARETAPALVGSRLTECGSTAPWTLGLSLDARRLTIDLDRARPTIFEDPGGPSRYRGGFPASLSERLTRQRLKGMETLSGERILRFDFGDGALLVELLPACPLIAWVEEGVVAAVHANGRLRTDRLSTGNVYAPPPPPEGVRFVGADRSLVDLLDPERRRDWDQLIDQAGERLDPVVITKGNRLEARAFPVEGVTIETQAETINEAARLAYTITKRLRREAEKRARIESDRKQLTKKITRTVQAVERDLEQAREWPKLERWGSALMASPHLVKRGATEALLPDVFDTEGGEITIPVDPKISVAENAAAYLKRSTRGKRSVDAIEKRLDDLREESEWIRSRGGDPAEWAPADRERFDELLGRHRVRRRPPPGKKAGPKRDQSGFHPRRYRSHDGWTILVGRNNAENDWLSLKYAKPNDIWLHAQGVPGSHVILRREGRKDNPSARTLEEAAGLAATFSRARHAGTVPVIYTLAKYVRKPRKAPPGLVTCEREKTILVPPIDPKELTHADDDRNDQS